jgi:pimeloyl-ACP methyl ester carboxylesterase
MDIRNQLSSWSEENWQGYTCLCGQVDGRPCRLVLPKCGLRQDRRWAWRAEFFGIFAEADAELLRRGYPLAYMDVQNHYGAPKAMAHFDAFYAFSRELQLHQRVALIGLSRGGLFVYNWAIRRPESTACIYADAPVCDIRCWPCGMRTALPAPDDRVRCLEMYGLTEKTLRSQYRPPIEEVAVLAKAGVPLIHVCGDADHSVVLAENTLPLLRNFMGAGGSCRLIIKPGCGHHPHGLPDPTPIADFIDEAYDGWAQRER